MRLRMVKEVVRNQYPHLAAMSISVCLPHDRSQTRQKVNKVSPSITFKRAFTTSVITRRLRTRRTS